MGGTMRALTREEIRHDPWDAADGGAVRLWIKERKQSVVNYTAHNQHVFRHNPLLFPEGHFSHGANARQLDQGAMMGTAQLRGLAGVLDGRRYRRNHRARPPSASPALRRRWQRRVLHIARARRSRFHRCRTEGAADGRDLFFDEHHFSVDQSYFRATAALISVSRPKITTSSWLQPVSTHAKLVHPLLNCTSAAQQSALAAYWCIPAQSLAV